jgi:hypothetical protein
MYLYSIEDRFSAIDDEMVYNNTDGILVPKHLWSSWVNTCTTTMIVRITQNTHQHTATQICCVAGYHEEERNAVYVPNWMFYQLTKSTIGTLEPLWEQLEYEDDEDEDKEESLPLATKIVLRPLDNEIYHADIEEELSAFLQNFQTLQKGSTLTVPISKLGDYLVDVFVEDCEPSNEVLLRGDVPLELAEPLETIAEWTGRSDDSTSTSPNTLIPNDEPFPEDDILLPIATPQTPTQPQTYQTQSTQPFIPFSGSGNRLGS